MSWLPAFEMGLWNAWILMLYIPLHPLIMVVLDKAVGTGDILRKMGDVPYNKKEKRIFVIYIAVILLLLVYSVFLPLKFATVWFFAGIAIYLVGLVMFLIAILNIATTPLDQPFTKGIYRYSRHPMLFSGSMTFVGVSVASASWIFLLLSVVIMVLQISQATAEERGCLKTYGDVYLEWLNKTPRWIGMPKTN